MNILFIASDNNYYSGAFLSMAVLCNILSKEFGHNVAVILPHKGTGVNLLSQFHIPYKMIHSYNWIIGNNKKIGYKQSLKIIAKKIINIFSTVKLVLYMKIHKIDIVHINTSYSYVGAVAARCIHIPYVWHIREFLEEDQNNRIWNRSFGYSLMSGADTLIAISDSVYQKYLKLLKTDRLVTIFNGIDETRFACESHKILAENEIRLLMVGGINKSKGQEQLIKACLMLMESGYNKFFLKIVGTGDQDYVEELQRFVIDNYLQGVIEFCGYISNTEDYYRWADIAFVCSRMEAFGRVTVEAMMAGAIVIGADAGGTRELIKDGVTGLLYKNGSTESLADRIVWVMENKDQAKNIAETGQKYVLSYYTARQNAVQIDKVYKKVANIRGGV